MKLTDYQMRTLLDHQDSPYIRCVGFLFLRYVHPPDKLWSWYEPYFLDDEEFSPSSDNTRITTIGEYAEGLITEDKYFTTVLPRLPVKIRNQYGAQLIAMDEHRKRKKHNKEIIDQFTKGAKVDACSNGDWLEGEVLSIVEPHHGRMSAKVKLEDGSEEVIDLALVVLSVPEKRSSSRSRHKKRRHRHKKEADEDNPVRENREKENEDRSRSRSRTKDRGERGDRERKSHRSGRRHRHHHDDEERGRDRKSRHDGESRRRDRDSDDDKDSDEDRRPKTQEELVEEFRKRQREKVVASGKDYARRPTSYKSSLSVRLDQSSKKRPKSASPTRAHQPPVLPSKPTTYSNEASHSQSSSSSSSSTRKEPSLEHKQKMAHLMEKYSKMPSQSSRKGEGPDSDNMRLGR